VRAGPFGHRHIGAKARAQLDIFLESADCRKLAIVSDRQLFLGAALRNNIADRIPSRQLHQNLTVVFADHQSSRHWACKEDE
jgi:hypothetical protein